MPSLNLHIIAGHLGKDPETRFTPSGVAKTSFSVATSERWKDKATGEWKEKTEWHNVVAWRKEWLANSLAKGALVLCIGRTETRSYEGRNGEKRYITELIADTVQVFDGRKANAAEPAPAPAAENPAGPLDDDVPF